MVQILDLKILTTGFLNSSTRFTIALAKQKDNLLCMEVGGTSQVKVQNVVAQDSCFYFYYSQTSSRSTKASWTEDYIDLFHIDPLEFTYSL